MPIRQRQRPQNIKLESVGVPGNVTEHGAEQLLQGSLQ
jgi:hypothetical protein